LKLLTREILHGITAKAGLQFVQEEESVEEKIFVLKKPGTNDIH